jgi:hypothetical protein
MLPSRPLTFQPRRPEPPPRWAPDSYRGDDWPVGDPHCWVAGLWAALEDDHPDGAARALRELLRPEADCVPLD